MLSWLLATLKMSLCTCLSLAHVFFFFLLSNSEEALAGVGCQLLEKLPQPVVMYPSQSALQGTEALRNFLHRPTRSKEVIQFTSALQETRLGVLWFSKSLWNSRSHVHRFTMKICWLLDKWPQGQGFLCDWICKIWDGPQHAEMLGVCGAKNKSEISYFRAGLLSA